MRYHPVRQLDLVEGQSMVEPLKENRVAADLWFGTDAGPIPNLWAGI